MLFDFGTHFESARLPAVDESLERILQKPSRNGGCLGRSPDAGCVKVPPREDVERRGLLFFSKSAPGSESCTTGNQRSRWTAFSIFEKAREGDESPISRACKKYQKLSRSCGEVLGLPAAIHFLLVAKLGHSCPSATASNDRSFGVSPFDNLREHEQQGGSFSRPGVRLHSRPGAVCAMSEATSRFKPVKLHTSAAYQRRSAGQGSPPEIPTDSADEAGISIAAQSRCCNSL